MNQTLSLQNRIMPTKSCFKGRIFQTASARGAQTHPKDDSVTMILFLLTPCCSRRWHHSRLPLSRRPRPFSRSTGTVGASQT